MNAQMGRGWQQNVEVLELLAKHGYGPAIEQAKQFGIYFDDERAKRAHEYAVGMHNLQSRLSGLALTLGESLIPKLLTFEATLVGVADDISANVHAAEASWYALTFRFAKAEEEANKATLDANRAIQDQTDFLVHLDAETRGAAESGKGLGGGFMADQARNAAEETAKLNEEWENGTKKLAVFGPSSTRLS